MRQGYPGNAASISMVDWTTGQGDAWFWVVKMFIDTLGSGPKDVHPTLVNGAPSDTTVRAVEPERWTCVHSMSIRAVAEAPGKWRYEAPAMPVWQRPALGSDLPSEFLEAFAPAPDAGEAPHPRAAHAASAPLYLNFDTS